MNLLTENGKRFYGMFSIELSKEEDKLWNRLNKIGMSISKESNSPARLLYLDMVDYDVLNMVQGSL